MQIVVQVMIQNFFFFFFGGGGGNLSPPRLHIFTVGNMGVMICLGQGGLRSLSASRFMLNLFYVTLKCPNPLLFVGNS